MVGVSNKTNISARSDKQRERLNESSSSNHERNKHFDYTESAIQPANPNNKRDEVSRHRSVPRAGCEDSDGISSGKIQGEHNEVQQVDSSKEIEERPEELLFVDVWRLRKESFQGIFENMSGIPVLREAIASFYFGREEKMCRGQCHRHF